MPELRKDPIIGRWVIISTERGMRPHDFPVQKKEIQTSHCPFCEGNEDKTPPEITAWRKDGTSINGPGWEIRVIPNKFPALKVEGELKRKGLGIFDKISGVGAHEVIIETPKHNEEFISFSNERIAKIFWFYRERSRDLKQDSRLRYILIFKNHGYEAGTSLEHSHSQLIATPITPKIVKEELTGAKTYFDYKHRCIFCDMIEQEHFDQSRIIIENESFIAISPFAARSPYEIWILPKRHSPDFDSISDEELTKLSIILKDIFQRLSSILGDMPYNYVIHTASNRNFQDPGYWLTIEADFHWHIELMPRLTRIAGFEWGTGFYINPTVPEDAAKSLREATVEKKEER